jgi:hypothetical protein
MKNIFGFTLLFLIVVFGPALAKSPNEVEMRKQAQELGFEGQLEKAQKMLEAEEAKEAKSRSSKDEGWTMTSIGFSLLYGAIGTGYFMYGKNQSKFAFLLCGILLGTFPMFVSDVTAIIVVGLVLTIIPFKVEF